MCKRVNPLLHFTNTIFTPFHTYSNTLPYSFQYEGHTSFSLFYYNVYLNLSTYYSTFQVFPHSTFIPHPFQLLSDQMNVFHLVQAVTHPIMLISVTMFLLLSSLNFFCLQHIILNKSYILTSYTSVSITLFLYLSPPKEVTEQVVSLV